MYISNGKKIEKENQKPREEIIWGISMLACGFLLYNMLNNLETEGGEMNINILLYFLYENFGKNIASLPFILFGIYKITSGILNHNNIKKWKEIEKEKNKEKFIEIGNKNYKITRNISTELILYLKNLNLDVKEGHVYMHYWSENLISFDKSSETYINQSQYFWRADEPFKNKALPDDFENFQQRIFVFTEINNPDAIKTATISSTVKKYYLQENNQILSIDELAERGLINYCNIEDLDEDNIGDMKYFEKDYFIIITNSDVKYQNGEFYIKENSIPFEILYSISAIELMRKKHHVVNSAID